MRRLTLLTSNSMLILKALLFQVCKKNERDTKIVLLNEVDIFMDFNSRMVGKEKENINIILL